MKNQSINTVRINLPKIPRIVADYLDWIAQQKDVMIFDVLSSKSIEKFFASLNFYQTKDEELLQEYIFQHSHKVTRAFLDGYLLDHQNYIEITPEMNWSEDPSKFIPNYVVFLGKEPRAYKSFEALQKLYLTEHNEHLTMSEMLLTTIDTDEEREEHYQHFISLHPDYKEHYKSYTSVANELSSELFDLIIPNNIQRMFEKHDFYLGTVGNNNWSYYAIHNDHNKSKEILDLWEGLNFYTIKLLEVDKNGLFIGYAEQIHFVYAPNPNDLLSAIQRYLGFKQTEIALVDNEVAQEINHVQKLNIREEVYIEEKVEVEEQ